MTDKKLMERALTEDPGHDTLMRWGQAREAGKEGVHSLAGGYSATNRVESINEDMSETEIEDMIETLTVMKVKKQGKYSGRPRREVTKQTSNCKNCLSDHPPGRCPARAKSVLHVAVPITSLDQRRVQKQEQSGRLCRRYNMILKTTPQTMPPQ